MIDIVLRVLAGAVLGLLFYGGLWYTVHLLATARHAGLLMAGSFWFRTLLVLAGFFWLAGSRFDWAIALVAGFAAGRLAVGKLFPFKKVEERCT